MRSFMSADVDYGRVAADANGTVIGTTAPLEQGVLVLDVANLKPRYHPSPTVAEPEGIRYLAISDGGAKAAVACGDIGPYRNPAGPASIFVVDMKTGVMRALRPDRHSVAKSAAVTAFGSPLIAVCIWLLWRTAPRGRSCST